MKKGVLHQVSAFRKKFGEVASTALISALGLIVALSWNNFIMKLLEKELDNTLFQAYPYLHELITALIITFIAVIVIIFITYWFKSGNKK